MGGSRAPKTRKLLRATAGLATLTYLGAASGSCTSGNLVGPPDDYGAGGTVDGSATGGSSTGGSLIGGGGTPPVTGGTTAAGGQGPGGACPGGAAGEGGQGGSSCQ